MWSRSELKAKAKNALRKHYIHAFIASFVLVFAAGELNNKGGFLDFEWSANGGNLPIWNGFVAMMAIFGILLFVGVVLFSIFVGGPLEVGARKYYVETTQYDDSQLSNITSIFGSSYYGNVVIGMVYQKIVIFLWFLALIVPGIVKAYAYSMVPYILAENPGMNIKDAMKLSDDMTYTHKMDMFILDLSFIGWYILGSLLFGIGSFFVNPYVDMTKGYLYLTLKEDIIEENLADESDFISDDPAMF